jgi:hypothetical protein
MIRYIGNEQGGVDVMRGNCRIGRIVELPVGVMFVGDFFSETAATWDEIIDRIDRAHDLPDRVERPG